MIIKENNTNSINVGANDDTNNNDDVNNCDHMIVVTIMILMLRIITTSR